MFNRKSQIANSKSTLFSKLFAIIGCLIILFSLCTLNSAFLTPVSADEVEELQKQINDLNKQLEDSKKATKPLEGQLDSLKKQLAAIQANLQTLSAKIVVKEKELDIRTDKLAQQQALLETRVRSYYVRSFLTDPLVVILSSGDAANLFRELSYRTATTKEDQRIISSITGEVTDLINQKDKLEKDKKGLAVLQTQVDRNAGFLSAEITKASAFQKNLEGKIAEMSAKQQSILAARSGNFIVNIGDSELADDYNASIKGFREVAPAGSFAVFSFGAYTHRKGMSQYGALGRVKAGQNYKQILNAYYGKEPTSKDTGGTIKVSGEGEMDFEAKYLYGIAEMPSNWPKEALKVQAVAARSYAYRYKSEGKEICTSEACQVYRGSKADNPPADWKAAVDETRGEIIEGVTTFYASTSGGYITTMGWDTTDGSGGSDFFNKTYEKQAGSPWAYKAWYTQGYSTSSDKCGRSNPWLNGEEMADIVNAALVLKNRSDDRITPISSCWGGNPYSMAELRDQASQYGGISSASTVTVRQGNGSTNEVVIDGITLSGSDFKRAFNLRAPGRMSIPQSGYAFFNIEKK